MSKYSGCDYIVFTAIIAQCQQKTSIAVIFVLTLLQQ